MSAVDTRRESPSIGFLETFALGGISAGIAKTVAAPLERLVFLQQSQHELIKLGKLSHSYSVWASLFGTYVAF
jgi:solute carrier family 25 (mitochondrial adenine nucleotide translocator), member 4/5/6/31